MASQRMLGLVSWHVSLQCSLQYHFGTAHGLGLVEKYSLPWHRQVSLPVMCQAVSITQPDRLTRSCDHANCVLRHPVGVTTVERPDPKGLSTFSQSTEFPLHMGFNFISSRSGVRHSKGQLADASQTSLQARINTGYARMPCWLLPRTQGKSGLKTTRDPTKFNLSS